MITERISEYRDTMTEGIDLIKLPELPVIEIVDDLVQVYKEFMVIRAALQIRLFDWMAQTGPATMDEICTGTGISKEYISGLLGMLYYLDIVRKSGEKYLVSPSANLHFVSSSNYYQGDVILGLSSEQSPWYDLASYLTNPEGHTTFEPPTKENGAAIAEQEIRGMVKNITTVMSRWAGFQKAGSLLEVGAGHGLYAIAACQIHQGLKAAVYIKPENSQLLLKNITMFGMESRISVVSDDLSSTEKSGPFDIILASHSLYAHQEQLPAVIRTLASRLNEEGLFISNHWFNRKTEGTGMQGLYELELAMHNRYHTIHDREAFESVCREQGLDLFQTGMMRSAYGESTIHLALKKSGVS